MWRRYHFFLNWPTFGGLSKICCCCCCGKERFFFFPFALLVRSFVRSAINKCCFNYNLFIFCFRQNLSLKLPSSSSLISSSSQLMWEANAKFRTNWFSDHSLSPCLTGVSHSRSCIFVPRKLFIKSSSCLSNFQSRCTSNKT